MENATENTSLETEKRLLQIGDSGTREKCQRILYKLVKEQSFEDAPAARGYHHAYPGGLDIHTAQVIDWALEINSSLKAKGLISFSEDDLIVAAFLHDLEKSSLLYFQPDGRIWREYQSCSEEMIVVRLCMEVGLVLSLEQLAAIEFAHGGWSVQAHNQYIKKRAPMADVIHAADLLSASFQGAPRE